MLHVDVFTPAPTCPGPAHAPGGREGKKGAVGREAHASERCKVWVGRLGREAHASDGGGTKRSMLLEELGKETHALGQGLVGPPMLRWEGWVGRTQK